MIQREYVADIIGNEFEKWRPGECYFITAPTGSGKTTFILDKLVRLAAKKRKKILYLVNRRLLKLQLEEKLQFDTANMLRREYNMNVRDVICVETYQTLEHKLKWDLENNNRTKPWDYVICDECHYFLHDSLFNTNVWYSFFWCAELMAYKCSTVIFLSATIGKVKEIYCSVATELMERFMREGKIIEYRHPSALFHEYTARPDYSYIIPHIFDKVEDVPRLLESDKRAKWLLFVNNIDQGKKLQEDISRSQTEDVLFVNREGLYDEECANEVTAITKKKKMSTRILIATSVLDNGVSLEDVELRNIVILTDTEDDFIQMLGRKRNDGKKVNLYFCKRDKVYFQNRYKKIQKALSLINVYYNWGTRKILDDTLNDTEKYDIVRTFTTSFCGTLQMNRLSIEQYDVLENYYKDLLERFDKDGQNAFLYVQGEWIGVDRETIEELAQDRVEKYIAEAREKIKEVLNYWVDKDMSKEDALQMKNNIRKPLAEILDYETNIRPMDEEIKKCRSGLDKNDRPISKSDFNQITNYLKLEYTMEKENGQFIIAKRQAFAE